MAGSVTEIGFLFLISSFHTSKTFPRVSITFPNLAVANFVLGRCMPAQETNLSPKCFVDKYKHCLKDRELYNYPQPQEPLGSSSNEYHTNYYPVGFRQASYTCEDKSYDECLTDNLGLL